MYLLHPVKKKKKKETSFEVTHGNLYLKKGHYGISFSFSLSMNDQGIISQLILWLLMSNSYSYSSGRAGMNEYSLLYFCIHALIQQIFE